MAVEEEEEERELDDGKDGALLLLRLPRREEKCVGEETGEEGGEQLWEGDCEAEEEEEGEAGTHGSSSSLAEGDSGCMLP